MSADSKDWKNRSTMGKILHPFQGLRSGDIQSSNFAAAINAGATNGLGGVGTGSFTGGLAGVSNAMQNRYGMTQRGYDKWVAEQQQAWLQQWNSQNPSTQLQSVDGNLNETQQASLNSFMQNAQNKKSADYKLTQNMASLGSAMGNFGQSLIAGDKSDLRNSVDTGIGAAVDVVGKFFPEVQALYGFDRFQEGVMEKMGMLSSGATKVGDVMNAIPGLDLFNFVIKRTGNLDYDQELRANVGAGYTGLFNNADIAKEYANSRYSMFELRQFNKKIKPQLEEIRQQLARVQRIADEAEDQKNAAESMLETSSENYQQQLNGGHNPKYAYLGKQGVVFEPRIQTQYDKIDFEPKITLFEPRITLADDDEDEAKRYDNVGVMKAGGRLLKELDPPEIESTAQKNIIPEGSMHRSYHHIENMKGFTKKGIPVLSTIDGMQAAEIEREEIIFSKEVTKKLEELYNIYFDEESFEEEKTKAALDAGKLLTSEIMCNTDDRTGLIDTLQKGGNVGGNNSNNSEVDEEGDEDIMSNGMHRVDEEMTEMDNTPHEQTDIEKKYGINEPPNPFQGYAERLTTSAVEWFKALFEDYNSMMDEKDNDVLTRFHLPSKMVSFDNWIANLEPAAAEVMYDELNDGNYDIKTAYRVFSEEKMNNFIDARLHPEAWEDRPVEDWHLGSVYVDEEKGDWVFLKKGFSVFDNPELGFQFEEFLSMPKDEQEELFTKKMMRFDKLGNRWVLIDREDGTNWQDDIVMLKCLMQGVNKMPDQNKKNWKDSFKREIFKSGNIAVKGINPDWFL